MTTFILLQAKREISPLAILVSFRGRKYRRSIGESVAVKSWNNRTKQVRALSGSDEAASVNERLRLCRRQYRGALHGVQGCSDHRGVLRLP